MSVNARIVELSSRRHHPLAALPPAQRLATPTGLAGLARRLVLARLARLQVGQLTLLEGGRQHLFGRLAEPLRATVTIRDPQAFPAIAFGGTIGAAESYADGLWDSDDLQATIRIVVTPGDGGDWIDEGLGRLGGLVHRLRHRARRNTRDGARANVAAHYDLGNDFFSLFLDDTMTYSCAVFEHDGQSLHDAQLAKIERICRKLDLQPGQHLLEIGTGWGALAIHAARHHGVRVTTTTLSRQQHELATARVKAAGLESRVEVLLSDYRDLEGSYDRVVSVEMIEAVGWEYYPAFMRMLAQRLVPDGLALVQAITLPDHRYEASKREANHINRIVFPGTCIPSTTALLQAASTTGDLRLFHLEEIGPHYATTLRRWRERLLARWEAARGQGRDERFLRTFEYYLASCEAAYAARYLGNVQLLFAKPGTTRAPILPEL